MNPKRVLLLLVLGCTLAPISQAQIKHIEMRVEGMTWNFWAYGVKQHLGRQSGVQNVEVSLIDGKVEITPKEDGQIDPAQLLKATYDSGVTAAEMNMTARGKIVKDSSGNLALQVAPNRSFTLSPNELAKELGPIASTETMVTVRGQLYKKPAGKKEKIDTSVPLKLLILDVEKKE